MKIAIYNVDTEASIPNLALMKIAAFHKERGDSVEHYAPLDTATYDKIYASTVFSFSDRSYLNPNQMEIGGSAWSLKKNLPAEIERMTPDYSFYDYPHSLGFSMRGCRFNCKEFCIVPEKEGKPKPHNTIDEIWTNRSSNFVVLLDNDFFGNQMWRERIAEIRKHDLCVNFSQGLNIRIITDEQCRALASVRFFNLHRTKRQVHFAWDRFKDEKAIDAGIQRVLAAGIKPYQMTFYILVGCNTTSEQDYYRVMKIRDYKCTPFVMPFDRSDRYQKRFARWVNQKAIFKSVKREDYRGNVKSKWLPVGGSQRDLF